MRDMISDVFYIGQSAYLFVHPFIQICPES